MNLDRVEKYTPEMLGVVRIVVALLFLEHGTAKLLGFPSSRRHRTVNPRS